MSPVLEAFLAQTAPSGPGSLLGNPLIFFAIMIAIFYLIVWRPQARERKKHDAFLQAIQKGDEVFTNSGFIGRIVQVEPRTVVVDVGGGTKLRVLRTALGGRWVENPQAEAAKTEAKK
jgi:preprotein translocase subunit YajC